VSYVRYLRDICGLDVRCTKFMFVGIIDCAGASGILRLRGSYSKVSFEHLPRLKMVQFLARIQTCTGS